MRAADEGAPLTPLTPDAYGRDLVAELPSLLRIADLETRILMTMDSGDLQPKDWITIAKEVHAAAEDPAIDGIVIVHGTDTMAYTASALGLLLGPVPKPVVLTGAQRPLTLARTDARENLIDAVLVAKVDAVRAEAPQRALDGQADVSGRAVQAADLLQVGRVDVLRAHLAAMAELAELRREDHLVAAAGPRPPDEIFVQVGP